MPRPEPGGSLTRANPASTLAKHRRVLAIVRTEWGETCEERGVPARSAHRVIGVGLSGIASKLVHHPTNLRLLCNDCLFHPGRRGYPWFDAAQRRSVALGLAA